MREKLLGPDDPSVGTTLNNLGLLYHAQSRFAEAEALYRRSLAVRETALGPEHLDVGTSLNNLGLLYRESGRLTEAEPLLRRGLAITEKAVGPEHPDVGITLGHLVRLQREQGQLGEAEQLGRRALAIFEKALGPDHPDVGNALKNLAELSRMQGRLAEAEALYVRSLGILEKALGPDHPDVGNVLTDQALLYRVQGRLADAEPLYQRSLAIYEKALGPEHLTVASALDNLARLHYDQSDWAKAAGYWRRSTDVIKRRADRRLASARADKSAAEAQRLASQFWGLVKTSYRVAAQEPATAAEMFETAQWVQGSEIAATVAQMAARSATGVPRLARLVRERQDLVSEWEAKDKRLIATKSEPSERRNAQAEKELTDRLAAIDMRLTEIDRELARDFPDYAALAGTAPVSVKDVQAQLGTDEALVLILDTPEWKPLPEETFIWIVTKTHLRWVRSDLGTAALAREVAALRCGLDATAWYAAGRAACAQALGIPIEKAPSADGPLPFDHARAYKLYKGLFGEVQDLIKGKQLLIVPSGPLSQLPFHVLLTKPPTSGANRTAAWLARAHAVTVVPAVSSLKALRRIARPSRATKPLIGFGNPLLDGYPGSPNDDAERAQIAKDHSQWAKLARAKQHCPEQRPQAKAKNHVQVAMRDCTKQRCPEPHMVRVEMRGGLISIASLKVQVPLPETADELCAVGQAVKALPGDIHLGAQATESEVKRLSASGELAQYRRVHFATHGVLSGQLAGTREPGLILTPPAMATDEDDGYLTASEIATLKLDADWVILSACNTAAGGAASADALSGLARAFIYAQARALLVSHWAVESDTTVTLITTAVRETIRDTTVGRAEALRRSMLALIDHGDPAEAHPAYWAPFVVVGEGAAGR
jgi:CHAT domain-containing protein/tetratricopeptide (TPR) repeat protein